MTKPKIKTDNDDRKKMLEELMRRRLGNNRPKMPIKNFQMGLKNRGRG